MSRRLELRELPPGASAEFGATPDQGRLVLLVTGSAGLEAVVGERQVLSRLRPG